MKSSIRRLTSIRIRSVIALTSALVSLANTNSCSADKLVGRAVLPADTFADGPTSGRQLGSASINGRSVPFLDAQPVQGFSAVHENGDGNFLAMSDNGFGSMENSADYRLRVYKIRPDFEMRKGGSGNIDVVEYIELHDPEGYIPFAITEYFTNERYLTGADFDIESMQKAGDGTLWFGDEFGPFLLHTDASGKVLEPPIALPDFDNPGREIRSPQNPFNEEASAIRIMNAMRHHARIHGNDKAPVFSPWNVMLDDGKPGSNVGNRENPPVGSGLAQASSELFNVASIQSAGYPIVTWTVNDKPRMLDLMELGVDGMISDRSDLLLEAVREFDADKDGTPGDFLTPEGLIDIEQFDAQGHRGSRNLRPENTLPAMEVALDNLMNTLELDCSVTAELTPVLSHDPYIAASKCSKQDGTDYVEEDEEFIKDLTIAQIQSNFLCDKLFRGPSQQNDPALSPVAVAFVGNASKIYVLPTLQQIFDFVEFYAEYYETGPGAGDPDAAKRAANARIVRFNIETKLNPRTDEDPKGNTFSDRTLPPLEFTRAIADVIVANGMEERADIQSFDFRSLLFVHENYPEIRTVCLFGDFPKYADPAIPGSDDGTNLQDQDGANTPWLAGLYWPYRTTGLTDPFRARRSGGFEGMALTSDNSRLLPLLERPLTDGAPGTLLIHEFDLSTKSYTGVRYEYPLDSRGTNIGDFVMFNPSKGLVIERDGTQGDLGGFKAIYEIELGSENTPVSKKLAVDLLNIVDPARISLPAQPGDAGLGFRFAFPFVTIEDVVVFDDKHIGVLNDNNFPFSIGRHTGDGQPDDNEFIVIELDRPLGK